MTYKKNKNPDRFRGNMDHIQDHYKRKKKRGTETSGVTGSYSEDDDKMNFKTESVNRIVSILTLFSLVLGFLVFLVLWLF